MNTAEQSIVDIALSIATQAHEGQLDKAGIEYIKHLIYVANQVKSEKEKAVALLHDVLEDSPVSAEELLIAGLPEEVVTAVKVLTKKPMQDYQAYLETVKKNSLARAVKLADLKHNSDLSRLTSITEKDRERLKKYKNAIDFLSR
ncbi:GTP pyrophosphokinase [Streptococcus infantis]|uniref:GTP pyrophosphokinase n=1 Tax=Streptococcus infantis TaxID=68892 RepID=UPI001CBFB105|nr:GTP pyrophosphokinase [Streptococcus infantis]MBZ2111068.1 GTP pyrophosphokinase [Streptococcus infantis]MBZ2112862.1 GTP pyrophosphokinase [Streptococcus infantis]MBZ2118760.1 GTP pyrophosphokinase [Streptococcus infantis]